jgi:hypothetical protein
MGVVLITKQRSCQGAIINIIKIVLVLGPAMVPAAAPATAPAIAVVMVLVS